MFSDSTWRGLLGLCLAFCLTQIDPPKADAFAFSFASTLDANIVAHPRGYNGTGGLVTVTVGIDATSMDKGVSNTALMATSVQNVVNTWNRLVPTTGNLIQDFTNIPVGAIDFETVLLHEMGHALGLAHPNMGSNSILNSDYTFSLRGPNNVYEFAAGVDGVVGTRDDVRGDDVNLNYFRTSGTAADQNNPFTIDSVVDSTTYSRDLADLPAGDLYSATSSRQNASTLGLIPDNTEAVLNQGSANNEVQRTLGHDDVAGLRYAQSGIDSIAGTADDYTLQLNYIGTVDVGGADIVIDFDNSKTNFAAAQTGGSIISVGAHADIQLTAGSIFFNDSANWHYNQVAAVPEPSMAIALLAIGLCVGIGYRRRATTTPLP